MAKFKLSEAAEAAGKSVATRVKDMKTGASELIIWDKKNGVEHEVPESSAGPLREQYLKPSWYDNHSILQPMLVEVPAEKPAPKPATVPRPGGAPGPA
jgi:hypothetical protein